MIYLIRHGQTDKNLAGRIQGQSDVPLNATGEAQAREAGALLRAYGISFSRAYSSPLSRAVSTAEIVLNECCGGSGGSIDCGSDDEPEGGLGCDADGGSGIPEIRIDERLIEMDYGPYEGTDLRNLPEEMKVFFSDFVNNPAPEGMEQLPDLVARLGHFLEDMRVALLADPSLNAGENVLLSTHAIAMKAALEYLTPGSNGAYWSKFVKNCAVYGFDLVNGEFTVPEEVVLG